jgi:eukaryotic-like serine/threonine-protein kinase
MGEVYRARDSRLGREVAIKVLRSDRPADETRRRSFIREAQAASALNHPNIVTVHDIVSAREGDSANAVDFIVMEHVAGRTLANAIPCTGMPLGQLLRVAIQVADALARAHAAGIVHRDLKPANVMVSVEGRVKVLDFGLAKLVTPPQAAGPESETLPNALAPDSLDRPGRLAGTIGYMSPEQAAGREVDARSDIFSFGALLYEIATGRRPFAADSTAEALAALMKDDPAPPRELTPDLPLELDRLIQRCLRKEPERRLQHMLDVKLELEQIQEDSDSGRVTTRPRTRRQVPWGAAGLVAALLLATATGVAVWRRWPREVPLQPPRLVPLTSMRGDEEGVAFSPDGEQVAFTWNGEKQDNYDIYLKMIGSSETRRLTRDPAMDIMPAWSPDGRQIAFVRLGPDGARVHLISPIGESDRKLSDFPVAFATPSWSRDGRWLAVARDPSAKATTTAPAEPGGAVYLLPVDGGEPRGLRIPQEKGDVLAASLSPDGHHLAYWSGPSLALFIAVVDLGSDYTPTGVPRRITRWPAWPDLGGCWARDGESFLYGGDWGLLPLLRLWRVDIAGERPPQAVEIAGLGAMRPAVALSRDRLAFVRRMDDKDIYRFGAGRADEPAIASSFLDADPQFSPDGRKVVFASQRSGESEIWLAGPDGSSPQQLTHGIGVWLGSPRWSPDGRRIAFDVQGEDGHYSIWAIDADGASPRRLTRGPGDQNQPSWSRDGRLVYFAARPDGAPQTAYDVWRVSAAGGAAERVTGGGGGLAYESMDGKTLFFMRRLADRAPLLAQPLAGGPERKVVNCVWIYTVGAAGLYYIGCSQGPEAPLFLRDPTTGRERLLGKVERAANSMTVSPDGRTILYTRDLNQGSDLMLIENFR